MRADDFVTSDMDARQAIQSLASTEATDAVNSHIVESADKSGMALKTGPLAARESRSSNALISTKTATDKAGELIGTVGKLSGDAKGASGSVEGAEGASAVSKSALSQKASHTAKAAIKAKAINAVLEGSELEGADEAYYKAKGTKQVAKYAARKSVSAARSVKDTADAFKEAVRSNDVSGGVSKAKKLGELSEKKSMRKLSPREINQKIQSIRNQMRSRKIAEAAKSGVGGSIRNVFSVKASASGGLGGLAGAVGGFILPALGTICLLFLVIIIIMAIAGGQKESKDVGALAGNEAIIAQALLDQGFTKAAAAGVLGNIANEGNPASDENMDGMFNYRYERACGMFQYTHASNSTPPYYSCGCEYCKYKRWCSDNMLEWSDLKNQMEWTFGEAGKSNGGNWSNRWTMRRTYYVGYWGAKYSWLNSSTLCNAADFPKLDDPAVAAYCWMAAYEGPTAGVNAHLDRRIESAQHYYDLLNTSPAISGEGFTDIVARAQAQLGKPYEWAKYGPNTFDCSGLVSYAVTGEYKHTYDTWYIYHEGKPFRKISPSEAVPGDIVCRQSSKSGHTGIYIGNGQMIHAPRTGDVVKIGPVQDGMNYYRYNG